MFDFGDEVPIESYSVPWLIWIQILVLVLLILLYCLALFVSDLPGISSTSPDFQLGITPVLNQTTALASQDGDKQSLKGEIGIARGSSGGGEEESLGMEGWWKKQANDKSFFHRPRYYFRLLKLALLKCLGLDFLCSDSTSKR